jgi:hypothetical protein
MSPKEVDDESSECEAIIQSMIIDFIVGKLTLRDFRVWFVPATWDIHEWAPERVQKLVYSVKLYMDEYTGGYRTEDELRRLFSLLLE